MSIAPATSPLPAIQPQDHKPLLTTDKLVKIYGGRTVVNGVDINVKRGEIVGLLGPNGAGKTTTLHMIVGLIRPNAGRVILGSRRNHHGHVSPRA